VSHAAAGGDPEAQYRLALAYRDGVGGAVVNAARAVGFAAQAAHQQHADAAFVYG
jgi:TPR repeat protein